MVQKSEIRSEVQLDNLKVRMMVQMLVYHVEYKLALWLGAAQALLLDLQKDCN